MCRSVRDVSKAVAASGSDATVEKITDLREIMALGVLATPLRWSSMAASCARGASPVRKKSGAGSAPSLSAVTPYHGNDGRAVPAMSGLRDLCCNHAKIRGRVADALPAFNLSPCPARLSPPPGQIPVLTSGAGSHKKRTFFPAPALRSAHVPWPAPAIPPLSSVTISPLASIIPGRDSQCRRSVAPAGKSRLCWRQTPWEVIHAETASSALLSGPALSGGSGHGRRR